MWFFLLLWFGDLHNYFFRLMSDQLMSLTTTCIDTIARKVQSNNRNMSDDNELRSFAMSEVILSQKRFTFVTQNWGEEDIETDRPL